MDSHLFFLDLIVTALQQPNPNPVIAKTLAKIEKQGREPHYAQGLQQFWLFMSEVSKHWEANESKHDHKIIVEYDGNSFGFIECYSEPSVKRMNWAQPGYYEVKFETGRIIWQGELTRRHLIWENAFPERDLELAADTGDSDQAVTKEIRLLNGELIIKIIPQIEYGCIELIVGSPIC